MATLQKSRCWLFTIDNCDSQAPYVLQSRANYISWNYVADLRQVNGYVQYAHPRAAAKIRDSKWCKSTAAFVESPECPKEYEYGRSSTDVRAQRRAVNLIVPEVMDPETYELMLARSNYICDREDIEDKARYLLAAERKRKASERADLRKNKSMLASKKQALMYKLNARSLSVHKDDNLVPPPEEEILYDSKNCTVIKSSLK